jgi:hypothetical protein
MKWLIYMYITPKRFCGKAKHDSRLINDMYMIEVTTHDHNLF